MHSDRFLALEAAFQSAAALSGPAREEWLAGLAREDPQLVAELRALLDADSAVGLLDRPPALLSTLQSRLSPELATSGTELPLPARVGRYVVAGEIGRGGAGVVCRAHDPTLGRDVALKIFPLVAGLAAEAERRVLAEARAASALDHPHICTIHDVGVLDDGRPFLAMAYYAGGTLADRIAAGPLSERAAVEIAHQVAEALAAAHAAGIVHRDVKPHNVAFAERGVAKLLDFGIAQLRDAGWQSRSAGTPAYMAPEQVRGERVDERADLWALGVMLFEMLAGHRPFGGPDRAATLAAIVGAPLPDIRSIRPDVAPGLANLLSQLLRREASERPPTAARVAAALRDVMVELDRQGAVHPHRMRRRIASGAAAVLVIAAAVAWQATRARPPSGADAMYARAVERMQVMEAQAVEQAIALLRSALSIDPEHARAHAQLARAYHLSTQSGQSRERRTEWFDSAAVHARRAIALRPSSAEGHSALGALQAARGRHADAIVHLRRAIDLAPRDAQAMMDLSASYMALDHFDEAFVWMERALREAPTLPGGRALAVGRYNVWEIPALARRHIAEGLRVGPADTELLWQATLFDLWRGDTASARRRLTALLPLKARLDQLRLQMLFEIHRGHPAAAHPFAERLLEAGGQSSDLSSSGFVFRAMGLRVRGDSLLREWLHVVRSSDSIGGRRSSRMALIVAHAHAALGQREPAFAELARFDSLVGLIQERRPPWEPGWEAIRDDPRYSRYVQRAQERFRASRARILTRLVREGVLPAADTSGR